MPKSFGVSKIMRKFAPALYSGTNGAGEPGIFQSGQMGQTVNLLAFAFGGSNPSVPTRIMIE